MYTYVAPLRSPVLSRYNKVHDKVGKFATTPGHAKPYVAYKAGAWKELSEEEAHKAALEKISAPMVKVLRKYQKDKTEEEIQAIAMAGAVELVGEQGGERTFLNGPATIVVQHSAGLDNRHVRNLLSQVDRWQTVAPVEELHLRVSPASRFDPNVYGETRLSTGDITLSGAAFIKRGHMGGVMPVADATSRADYVIAHEWGHTQSPPIAKSKMSQLFHTQKTSYYGGTHDEEAFAEAWAEFHLTDGLTDNLAAQKYAKTFGWKATP